MINKNKFNEVLEDLYTRHVNAVKNPALLMKKQDKGWCKDLDTLLKNNCFQEDSNEMLGITQVGFEIEQYLYEKDLPGKDGETFTSPNEEFQEWLCNLFKINMKEVTALEYNHDINLAEFNNARYFILRDTAKKLYLFVYTLAGEYLEKDLESLDEKKDFSSKFRIDFYNKYNNIK